MNRGLLIRAFRESWPTTLLLGLVLMGVEAAMAFVLPNSARKCPSMASTGFRSRDHASHVGHGNRRSPGPADVPVNCLGPPVALALSGRTRWYPAHAFPPVRWPRHCRCAARPAGLALGGFHLRDRGLVGLRHGHPHGGPGREPSRCPRSASRTPASTVPPVHRPG